VTRCYLANLFPQKGGFGPRLVIGVDAVEDGDGTDRSALA
jgi:hypothetical protein